MKAMRDTIATLASVIALSSLFSGCATTPVASNPVGPPWTGETFLPNYAELKPVVEKTGGTSYAYLEPNLEQALGHYSGIMVDQPEIFIGENSPYKGAKPADLDAIAEFARSTFVKHLTAHGYKVVDVKGPGVLYLRTALTHLQLQPKSRSILAYTPVGFVVSTTVRAIQDLMEKMDILKVAMQGEALDAQSGKELGAVVIPKGGDGTKMTFSQFEAVIDTYGERTACRLDNARLPQAQWIDCSDPDAVKARPKVQ
jgi:hypothetical protein